MKQLDDQTYGTRRPSELDGLRLLTGAICICILVVILIAGLWPFLPQKNDVEWLQGENGIRFGHRGIVVSTRPLRGDSTRRPVRSRDLPAARSRFRIGYDRRTGRQSRSQICLRLAPVRCEPCRAAAGARCARKFSSAVVEGRQRIQKGRSVLLTIASVRGRTTLYVDGVQASVSSDFGLTVADLTGRVILGSSANQDSWHGDILGLAIYDVDLSPSEVVEHAGRWLRGQPPAANSDHAPSVLYKFRRATAGTSSTTTVPPETP